MKKTTIRRKHIRNCASGKRTTVDAHPVSYTTKLKNRSSGKHTKIVIPGNSSLFNPDGSLNSDFREKAEKQKALERKMADLRAFDEMQNRQKLEAETAARDKKAEEIFDFQRELTDLVKTYKYIDGRFNPNDRSFIVRKVLLEPKNKKQRRLQDGIPFNVASGQKTEDGYIVKFYESNLFSYPRSVSNNEYTANFTSERQMMKFIKRHLNM